MSSLVRAEIDIDAPAAAVWAYVTDWPRQAEWIPLTRVEAVDDARSVGGRLRAWTGVGPVGFWDTMTISVWEEPAWQEPTSEESSHGSARCEVVHTGAVLRGDGGFVVTARGGEACTFTWWERLSLPGGRAMRTLADWSLRRLAARMEEQARAAA
jgi:uncharacterized protein YndB with AHSA1/START domain